MSALVTTIQSRLRHDHPVPTADTAQRCAAVSVILRVREHTEVMLLQRAERQGDPWSGQIGLPGGRYEPTDQTLFATALRETHEETAVDLSAARFLGCAPAEHPISAGPRGMPVTPFAFALAAEHEPTVQLSAEATSWFWFPLDHAKQQQFDGWFDYKRADGTSTRFPCWQFGERRVWGLTMRILATLIQ